MSAATFDLPDLGEGLEDAEILNWLVGVGDVIELDQEIVEVETSKATVVIPSPLVGRVSVLHAAVGDLVDVGSPLITVETDAGEAASGAVLIGYGTSDQPARRRRRVVNPDDSPTPVDGAPKAKPPVRKLARDLGVDLDGIVGTGGDGAITEEDIRRAAQPVGVSGAGAELRGTRRSIARAMEQTLGIPDAAAWLEADASGLLAVTDELGDITPFALAMRVVVAGLAEHRSLTGRYNAEGLEETDEVHLGIATQTERGLLVPVIRDAHRLGARELGEKVSEVAAAARAGSLPPSALSGSTFSVTNYGYFGVDGGHPIINPPNLAILGIGAIRDRVIARDGVPTVAPMAELAVVFDHRFNDGSTPSAFLRFVAEHLGDADKMRALL